MEAKRFLWVSGSSQATENGDGKSSEKARMEASQRLRVALQSSEQGTNLTPGSFETRAVARLRSWEPGTDMELRSLRSLRSLSRRFLAHDLQPQMAHETKKLETCLKLT